MVLLVPEEVAARPAEVEGVVGGEQQTSMR